MKSRRRGRRRPSEFALENVARAARTSMEIVVNISDMRVSSRQRDVLVTHSLGSCLGLAVYDPQVRVGGLIHCLLPVMPKNRERSNRAMFVNTGVPDLIRVMYRLKARRENLVIKAAGCGKMINVFNQFDTGSNNYAALRKLLEKNDLRLAAEDVGGTVPRTIRMSLDTGKVIISSLGKSWEI